MPILKSTTIAANQTRIQRTQIAIQVFAHFNAIEQIKVACTWRNKIHVKNPEFQSEEITNQNSNLKNPEFKSQMWFKNSWIWKNEIYAF